MTHIETTAISIAPLVGGALWLAWGTGNGKWVSIVIVGLLLSTVAWGLFSSIIREDETVLECSGVIERCTKRHVPTTLSLCPDGLPMSKTSMDPCK
jgi:hypothetical protein